MIDASILEKVKRAREEGKTIGLVQGSWDMFHIGHLRYLKNARSLCDFLIVGMDDDEKIRFRKGNKRPIIPLVERKQMIEELNICDVIAVKTLKEKRWELIKTIKPDVLIAIKENYKEDEIEALNEYCGKVAILPRQATTSTSDVVRNVLIKNGVKIPNKKDPRVEEAIEKLKERIGYDGTNLEEPWPSLIKYLKNSSDWKTPTSACCYQDGQWYYGINQIDTTLDEEEREKRTELFYSTVEHGEINLLKQLNGASPEGPVYSVLFPCDKCMKVLIDKGVKEIHYLEDHPDRNWSKRSHKLAEENNIKLVHVTTKDKEEVNTDYIPKIKPVSEYKYINPYNVRDAKQLDIMLTKEENNEDPLAPDIIDQEILFKTDYWYITKNRFPIAAIEHSFLIVSLNPIYNVDDVSKEMWQDLQNICNKLRKEYNLPGGALCHRFGDTTRSGATLKRVHAHLIVPKLEYKSKFTIGGNTEIKKEIKEEYRKLILAPNKNGEPNE